MSINREFISKLFNDVIESVGIVKNYVNKPYEDLSEAGKFAIRYHLIVIAGALMATILHVTRRALGITPETPIHALNKLREKGLVSDVEFKDIVNIIKLRNLLVPRYWVVDDMKIYENIRKNFSNVVRFMRRLVEYASSGT